MENPCNKCVVKACCTLLCYEYGVYLLDNNLYPAGVHNDIQERAAKDREDAIKHVLICEQIHRDVNEIAGKQWDNL